MKSANAKSEYGGPYPEEFGVRNSELEGPVFTNFDIGPRGPNVQSIALAIG